MVLYFSFKRICGVCSVILEIDLCVLWMCWLCDKVGMWFCCLIKGIINWNCCIKVLLDFILGFLVEILMFFFNWFILILR